MSEPGLVDAGQIPITSPISKSEQGLLFPLRALTELTKVEPSADSLGEVQACDGLWYHVKGDGNGRPTRASEWLRTMIADAVGIGAPQASVIQLQNDDLVFGSRRLAGVADKIRTRTYLTKLNSLSLTIIRGFLERMPTEWLTPELHDDFIRMWSGEERQARINALRKGLGDGSLL
jgi:hypothetical protein